MHLEIPSCQMPRSYLASNSDRFSPLPLNEAQGALWRPSRFLSAGDFNSLRFAVSPNYAGQNLPRLWYLGRKLYFGTNPIEQFSRIHLP